VLSAKRGDMARNTERLKIKGFRLAWARKRAMCIGGEARDSGSLEQRATNAYVWNAGPAKLECHTETWNEFLAR